MRTDVNQAGWGFHKATRRQYHSRPGTPRCAYPGAVRQGWQNPYSERLNGSIRREYLDRVIVFGEAHLRRVLTEYFEYYNRYRVHQSLEMDTPEGRNVQTPEAGVIVAVPHVNGLHHHYERKAA